LHSATTLGIVIVYCAFPGNKVTSLSVETMQCAVQSRIGEAEFPSREDFQKMAKCGRKMDS